MLEKQQQHRVGAYVLQRPCSAAALAPEQLDPYRSGGLGVALLDVEPDAILKPRPVKRLVRRLADVAVAQRCAGPRRRPLRRLEQEARGVLRPRILGHRRAAALEGGHDNERRFQDKGGQVHWPSARSREPGQGRSDRRKKPERSWRDREKGWAAPLPLRADQISLSMDSLS